MSEDIVSIGTRQADEIRNFNRDLIEKSLQMRCLAYLSAAKAKLLTETIFEVDGSRKNIQGLNINMSAQNTLILRQKESLQTQLEELALTRQQLEQTNAELAEKNLKLEKFNKMFVDRELRIKELKDQLAKYKRQTQ